MPRGGRRPNAGRKKKAETIDKEALRDVLRQMVCRSFGPLIRAQIVHALGVGHLYVRDAKGKYARIEDQKQIDALLTEGTEGEHYWIFAKDPSVQAFTDLMNRALDKPKEQEQEIKVSGAVDVVAVLRRRFDKAKQPA